VSLIDIRDIAACAAVVLTTTGHEGQAYTLTGPESLSYGDAAQTLSQVIGRPISYQSLEDTQLRTSLQAAQWPADLIGYVSHLYNAVQKGYRQEISPTLPNLIQRPAITFAQYARDHVSAWQ